MQTENLIFYSRRQRQEIEQICIVFPHICIAIFAQTLIIEPINLCDLSGLVIASQDGDPVLEPHFQGHKEGNSLDWIVTSVDVVSHEEIISVRRFASNFEKFHEVVKLTMYVSAHRDWAFDRLHITLIGKNFFRLLKVISDQTLTLSQRAFTSCSGIGL